MGAVKQWALEQHACAERLYHLLCLLVGDIEGMRLTGAKVSWQTPEGIAGYWRDDHGAFWVGRVHVGAYGRQGESEHLVLALDSVGEDEDWYGLAEPTCYRHRTADGITVVYDTPLPQSYAAAEVLLTVLNAEVRAFVLHGERYHTEPAP